MLDTSCSTTNHYLNSSFVWFCKISQPPTTSWEGKISKSLQDQINKVHACICENEWRDRYDVLYLVYDVSHTYSQVQNMMKP